MRVGPTKIVTACCKVPPTIPPTFSHRASPKGVVCNRLVSSIRTLRVHSTCAFYNCYTQCRKKCLINIGSTAFHDGFLLFEPLMCSDVFDKLDNSLPCINVTCNLPFINTNYHYCIQFRAINTKNYINILLETLHITAEINVDFSGVTVTHDEKQHGTLNCAMSRYDGMFPPLCYVA